MLVVQTVRKNYQQTTNVAELIIHSDFIRDFNLAFDDLLFFTILIKSVSVTLLNCMARKIYLSTCIYVPVIFVTQSKCLFQDRSVLSGRVGQSVTCLATDASLTADPGAASSIAARSHSGGGGESLEP